ncbi:hypothetical protein T439DRAFT_131132 [Meredithblackwellia eburnea MCA 4105]
MAAPKKAKGRPSVTSTKSNGKKKNTPAKKSKKADDFSDAPTPSSTSGDSDDASSGYNDDEDESAVSEEELSEEDEDDSDVDSEDIDKDDADRKKKKRKAPANKKSPGGSGKKPRKSDPGGLNTREVETIPKAAAPKVKAETSIILPTTLDFLKRLKSNNDRPWFQAHDAQYRHALLNWTTFINALVPVASEADWTLPPLPAKDLIHRIYRDVRFSKEKTPYKTNFALSLSRTGRKGPFCLYYIHISPGNSILACGKWQPSGEEIKVIRDAILADPKPLREVLNEPEFVKLFGDPKPKGHGKRTSVFGHEDELKNCPKIEGVTKDHPDIDLLKLRSVAVSTPLTDEEVLSDEFIPILKRKMEVVAPFVQCINEMIMPTPPSDDDE